MNDPASLSPDARQTLQEITLNYPYFQTARLLNLIHLKLNRDYRFEQELRKVAAFSADRSRVRELLLKIEADRDTLSGQTRKDNVETARVEDPEKEHHLKKIEEQIRESLKEIELKRSRLMELMEEKKSIVGAGALQDDTSEEGKELPYRPLPKDTLLEQFIREKDSTGQNRTGFFNPEESARKSIEENEDILSETLARLVAAQGKKDKAIKIYQKLMLKYPQKSSYFAAQIEKLRKEP